MSTKFLLHCTYLLSIFILFPVQAQIVPDDTLPQNSEVIDRDNIIQIDGGTEAGDNLFHSFEEFSVEQGKTAWFNNNLAIENIFSRVTGQSISNIDGLIKANGNANLFLINPNGIIFGKNAALDIGGSFLATTANSINFADGEQFLADKNQTQPLLTISAPIGLGFTNNAAEITNSSQASPNSEVNTLGFPVGLRVKPNKTIALVGGSLNLDGGSLTASGGRIELGSVSGNSTVGIQQTQADFELNYDNVEVFQDIKLSNSAVIDSSGNKGGGIQIQGNNIDIVDSSVVANSLGSGKGEDLIVNASESINLTSRDKLTTIEKLTLSSGDSGNLIIETKNLTLRDGAFINTSIGNLNEENNLATGKPADLIINASNSIDLIGISQDVDSGLYSFVNSNAAHKGGSIQIKTKKLSVREGALIRSLTYSNSSVGNISITASDTVEISGINDSLDKLSRSNISNLTFAEGDSGDIFIDTAKLIVKDGANISSLTLSNGNAGDVTIITSESVDIEGFTKVSARIVRSGIFAQVNTDEPNVTGNAGELTIKTKNLTIRDGGVISTTARSEGKGGNLFIDATESVFLSGTTPIDSQENIADQGRGGIFTSAQLRSTKEAGDLTINTKNLTVEKGAEISANTFGRGNSGNALFNVERLIVRDGGRIGAGSFLKSEFIREDITDEIRGAGGTITINATESVEISGTGIIGDTLVNSTLLTKSEGTGDAGNLSINTPALIVKDGGEITAQTSGEGNAGNITLAAGELILDDGSISTQASVSNAGDIKINVRENIELRGDSDISSLVESEEGDGGNITLEAGAILAYDDSDIFASAEGGEGGNITLNTPAFFGEGFTSANSNSNISRDELDGNNRVDIDATGRVNGVITLPNVRFVQQDLAELPTVTIDTETLLATSCIVRSEAGGSFIITGRGGLPTRPQDAATSFFSTGTIQTIPSESAINSNNNNEGEVDNPIIEPTGVYRLPNGQLIISHECQ